MSEGSQGCDRRFMEGVPAEWGHDMVEAVVARGSFCLPVFEALLLIFLKGVGARSGSGGLRLWSWLSQ